MRARLQKSTAGTLAPELRRGFHRIVAFAAALACIACLWGASTASAAPTKDGWGFGVADDSSFPWGSTHINTYFGMIAPKTFRLQVSYDAWSDPAAAEKECPTEPGSYRDRILARINGARAAGVQHILVTFAPKYSEWDCKPEPLASHLYTRPPQLVYQHGIEQAVAALAPIVDSWSPANEPNAGIGWLAGTAGAEQLAAYYLSLKTVLNSWSTPEELISPEFVDQHKDNLYPYLDAYKARVSANSPGDLGWGAHAALHPYTAVKYQKMSYITDFLNRVPSGTTTWFTEVGASRSPLTVDGQTYTQATRVEWLVNHGVADPRVSRAYYYNMWNNKDPNGGNYKPEGDFGLIGFDSVDRAAFGTWCRAAHGGYADGVCPFVSPTRGDTVGVYRGPNFFLTNRIQKNPASTQPIGYGGSTAVPVMGDWDGNGTDTIGVYWAPNFYLRNSNTPGPPDYTFEFGLPGDRPVIGNWDGAGGDGIGVWRGAHFYLKNTPSGGSFQHHKVFGLATDRPLAGDWDGNGVDSIGVHRPPNFYLSNSNTSPAAHYAFEYGLPSSVAVTGDWDGNGADGVGVVHGATWYLKNAPAFGQVDYMFEFGLPGDLPVAGNFDGI